MIVEQILVGSMANFTYVIADEKTKTAAIIDPSWDLEKVMASVEKNGLRVQYVINTHTHFDHVLGNKQIAALTSVKIIMHKNSSLQKDMVVDEGDTIQIGEMSVKVMYTPGHSKDSVCLLVGNKLFTGDTLFVGNCGRVDLPGGSAAELYDSLARLAKLDDSIEVYPGHDYGNRSRSTIGEEKKSNYVLKPRSKEQFLAFMQSDD
jgi:glyoxylase-like metal-dependent hydrolase (beta-lactamase superfamily II)